MTKIVPDKLYTKPTLYKGSANNDAWHVEYYHWNHATDKMERVRVTNNFNRKKHSPTLKDKKENFNNLLEVITEDLEDGYSPFDKVKEEQFKNTKVSLTLDEAAVLFKKERTDLRAKSLENYLSAIARFIKVVGGEVKINQIDTNKVRDVMSILERDSRNGKWRNASFNNYRIDITNFFTFLVERKYLVSNPVAGIKLKTQQTTEAHEVFEDEDIRNIFEWLAEYKPKTFLFCQSIYYTCIRPNELRQLKVRHVNLDTNVIYIPSDISKNHKDGYINIDSKYKEHLLQLNLSSLDKEEYLFNYRQKVIAGGIKMMGRNTMYRSFQLCLDALELHNKNYTLYSFKHTTNYKRFKAGWSLENIMKGNRHSNLLETQTYLKKLMKFSDVMESVPAPY